MPADALVVSSLPSRLRLRVPARCGNRSYFEETLARVERVANVVSASANPTTGSLLVTYRGPFEELAAALEAADLFVIERGEPETSHRLDDAKTTGALALAGAFAALGLMQLGRRRALPPALTLMWYAASLASKALRTSAHR
jgi:hypothetical protein